jgi:hypothetical protein
VKHRWSTLVGALTAAVLAQGLVYAAIHFDKVLPAWSYYGIFQQVAVAVESIWSRVHGWPPLSHVQDFGWFYAAVIHLSCPLIGFLFFGLLSRSRVSWKPFLIVALCAPVETLAHRFFDSGGPWMEASFALTVFALMVASLGGFPAIRRYSEFRNEIRSALSWAVNPMWKRVS